MADARNARANLQKSDVLDQKQQLKQQRRSCVKKFRAPIPASVLASQATRRNHRPLKRVETESQSAKT